MVSMRQIQARRERLTRSAGSPRFHHRFGAISAAGNAFVNLQATFPASRKYEPLTTTVFTNNSSEALDVEINGRDLDRVPPGVIRTYNNQAVWSFRVTNNDSGTAASGLVTATFFVPATSADQEARENA